MKYLIFLSKLTCLFFHIVILLLWDPHVQQIGKGSSKTPK